VKQAKSKPHRELTPEVIARFAERATKPSAKLEGRVVPSDYQCSAQVAAIIAERYSHA